MLSNVGWKEARELKKEKMLSEALAAEKGHSWSVGEYLLRVIGWVCSGEWSDGCVVGSTVTLNERWLSSSLVVASS